MRTIGFFILIGLFALSCGSNSSNALASSDSLVIQFNSATGTTNKTINTIDKTAIRKLAAFTQDNELTESSCQPDGVLLFYKQGVSSGRVWFHYSEANCHHFVHFMNLPPKELVK